MAHAKANAKNTDGSDVRATSATIQAEVISLRDRLDLIWKNHEREHTQHDASHAREHEFAQQAITTAAILSKENKADANEWRKAMDDRERTFATKTDIGIIAGTLDELKESNIKRLEVERLEKESAAQEREQQRDQVRGSQWKIGLLVGTMATTGSILISLILRLME